MGEETGDPGVVIGVVDTGIGFGSDGLGANSGTRPPRRSSGSTMLREAAARRRTASTTTTTALIDDWRGFDFVEPSRHRG